MWSNEVVSAHPIAFMADQLPPNPHLLMQTMDRCSEGAAWSATVCPAAGLQALWCWDSCLSLSPTTCTCFFCSQQCFLFPFPTEGTEVGLWSSQFWQAEINLPRDGYCITILWFLSLLPCTHYKPTHAAKKERCSNLQHISPAHFSRVSSRLQSLQAGNLLSFANATISSFFFLFNLHAFICRLSVWNFFWLFV